MKNAVERGVVLAIIEHLRTAKVQTDFGLAELYIPAQRPNANEIRASIDGRDYVVTVEVRERVGYISPGNDGR